MRLSDRLKLAYRSLTLADFPQTGWFGTATHSGVAVTAESANGLSAYRCAIQLISAYIGLMPRILYKRIEGDERERAITHPAYKVVHNKPSKNGKPMDFWQTLTAHALAWGNGYAEIEFDAANRPTALHTITPDSISPKLEGDELVYMYAGGSNRRILAKNIIHVAGLGFDGIQGQSVFQMARQSIGLALAAEQFGASFYGNGAQPGIALKLGERQKLSKEAHERLSASWKQSHGNGKQLGVAILEEGMTVEKLTIPQDDAQFLESREFQVVEIARWFNCPPHKLLHKIGERPGGNLEASQIDFLTDTLLPWMVRIEQECNRKLIPEAQSDNYYFEHLSNIILRPTAAERVVIQKAYFDMGVLDAEAIAKQENLPKPKPKPRLEPVQPAEPTKEQPPTDFMPEPRLEQFNEDKALQTRWARETLLDAAGRVVKRDVFHLRKLTKRGALGFDETLSEFYRDETPLYVEMLRSAVGMSTSLRGLKVDVEAVTRGVVRNYVAQSMAALGSLPVKTMVESSSELLKRWSVTRPAVLADAIERCAGGNQ